MDREIDNQEILEDHFGQEEKEDKVQEQKKNKKGIWKEVLEWILCFFIAYVIYLNINYFLGTISGVKQSSMYPTAVQGERVLVQRPTLFKKVLKYGDIITFEAPVDHSFTNSEDVIAQYNEYKGFSRFLYEFVGIGQMNYIKRVIGLPGDHIVIGDDGYVYRNDEKLEEPYLRDGTTNQLGEYIDVIVPEKCVFVMGDNRLESKDSRMLGCIPMDKVNGYVVARVWPFNKFGQLE